MSIVINNCAESRYRRIPRADEHLPMYSYNERRNRMDGGYPKFIHRGIPGIGHRVDSAFENRGR